MNLQPARYLVSACRGLAVRATAGPTPHLAVLLILMLAGWSACSRQPLEAVVPELPPGETLGPQLRAYLESHQAWVQASPADPQRQAVLGMVFAANALWSQAWLSFSNVVRLHPTEPLGALYLAIATDELGDAAGALSRLETLTERFPSFPQGFYRLGQLSLRTGDVATAETAFTRLIKLAPAEWWGYAGLGEVLLRRGQTDEAIRWIERAVELAPDAAPARHLLGTAYRGSKRLEEAAIELKLGTSDFSYPMPDPWSESAHAHMLLLQDQIDRAGQYVRHGQADRAVQLLATALHYEPNNISLLNNLAIALNEDDKPAQAVAALERVLELEPANLPAHINLSLSLRQLDRPQDALAWADKARRLSPKTAQVHLARANALLALEQDETAVAALSDAAACEPRNADIRLELGNILLLNLGREEDALAAFRLAVELDPAHLGAWLRLADLRLERGEHQSASEALLLLERIAPSLPMLAELRSRLEAVRAAGKSNSSP